VRLATNNTASVGRTVGAVMALSSPYPNLPLPEGRLEEKTHAGCIVHLLPARASSYVNRVVACFTLGMLYNHADASSKA
jgi:hypothetical protein